MKMKGARISGGTHSAPLTHPWMAKINRNCGGALIENPIDNVNKKIRSDLILTAAHCVNMESNDGPEGFSPSRVRIRLGVHRDDILEIAQEFHKANKIVSHRDFDYQTKHNDIALIQLEKLVDFSNFIGPISLPPEDAPVPVSQPCKAMGWGRVDIDQDGSKVLKEVKLQVTNSCRSMDTAAMIKGNVFCTEPVENAEDNICIHNLKKTKRTAYCRLTKEWRITHENVTHASSTVPEIKVLTFDESITWKQPYFPVTPNKSRWHNTLSVSLTDFSCSDRPNNMSEIRTRSPYLLFNINRRTIFRKFLGINGF
uniref:Peptidase S1 domain-containing protein n=1 Tax=Romanomermis culicivorax TaxID=13658 RepID=A0A915LA82_ROMCU